MCQWLFGVFLFFSVFLVLFCVSSVRLCLWCIFVSLGLFVVPLYILCVCLWSSFSILVIIQSELGQFNDVVSCKIYSSSETDESLFIRGFTFCIVFTVSCYNRLNVCCYLKGFESLLLLQYFRKCPNLLL